MGNIKWTILYGPILYELYSNIKQLNIRSIKDCSNCLSQTLNVKQ